MDTITVAAAGIHSAMLEREDDSRAVYYNGCVEMLGVDRTLTKLMRLEWCLQNMRMLRERYFMLQMYRRWENFWMCLRSV